MASTTFQYSSPSPDLTLFHCKMWRWSRFTIILKHVVGPISKHLGWFTINIGENLLIFCFVLSYSSRHRTIDLYKLDCLCPNLQSLSVAGSFISYKPGLAPPEMIHSKTFSALKELSLKETSEEGDQCNWKRLVKQIFLFFSSV